MCEPRRRATGELGTLHLRRKKRERKEKEHERRQGELPEGTKRQHDFLLSSPAKGFARKRIANRIWVAQALCSSLVALL